MAFPDLIAPLLACKDFTPEQAQELMRFLMSGEATDAQIGGVLLGLRVKGCNTRELAAFATVLREMASTVSNNYEDLVDTCGTGGGIPSFNISTASAIVAAAAGVRIAKHGNRAVTSVCGSVDVLEHLGVKLAGDPEQLLHSLETKGIVFMFAQTHHVAVRHVAAARKQLGFRTVFNQLGPLANPAGAKRQIIGVFEPGLMRSMGEALNLLGSTRSFLVHGKDGLDEISPCAPTEVVKVWHGKVSNETFTPEDFGLKPLDPSALSPGATLEENAQILLEAISDIESPRSQAILPSVAAAIVLSGIEESFIEATERAKAAIRSGAAVQKLRELSNGDEDL